MSNESMMRRFRKLKISVQLCSKLFALFLFWTIFLMKNSPALYELRTSGPLAVYKNPSSPPLFSQNANFSGVTYSTTLRWRFVGCMYWPKVRQSAPADLKSIIVCSTSESFSPAKYFKWYKMAPWKQHTLNSYSQIWEKTAFAKA